MFEHFLCDIQRFCDKYVRVTKCLEDIHRHSNMVVYDAVLTICMKLVQLYENYSSFNEYVALPSAVLRNTFISFFCFYMSLNRDGFILAGGTFASVTTVWHHILLRLTCFACVFFFCFMWDVH